MANLGNISGQSLVINGTGSGTGYQIGVISATSNVQAGNLRSLGLVSAVGTITGNGVISTSNVQAGNLRTTGLISAAGTITGANLAVNSGIISGGNIISAGPISAALTISAAGNITGGNIRTVGQVSATGNVTGNYFVGNGSQLTGISGSANAALLTGTGLSGNVIYSQLTSVGTLTSLSVTGNVRSASFIGNGSQLTGINGPAFIATGTNQSIPASPSTVSILPLIFTGVTKNINSGYNPSTGIFTAPTAGFYQVSATVGVSAPYVPPPAAAGALILYQSGTAIQAGSYIAAITVGGTTVINSSSVSRLVYLNVGQTLQCALAYIGGAGWSTYTNLIPGSFQACWLRS